MRNGDWIEVELADVRVRASGVPLLARCRRPSESVGWYSSCLSASDARNKTASTAGAAVDRRRVSQRGNGIFALLHEGTQAMTTPAKWNPYRELEELMDAYRAAPRRGRQGEAHEIMTTADWAPVVDIRETEKEYLIKAELPEVKKDHVKVSINDGVLIIQGERSLEKEEGDPKSKYHRIERSYGSFARSFTLPDDVETEKIEAEHKEGMLYVHLPKHAVPPSKKVEVKVK
jgi:HSP20 family protein